MRVIITNKQITIFSNNANNQSITMCLFLVDKELTSCSQTPNFLLAVNDIPDFYSTRCSI